MKRWIGLVLGGLALVSGCELVVGAGEISGKTLGTGGSTTSSTSGTTSAPQPCAGIVSWVRVIEANAPTDLRVSFDAARQHVVVGATVDGDVRVEGQPYPAAGDSGRDVLLARFDGDGAVERVDRLGDTGDHVLGGIVAASGSTVVAMHYSGSLGLGAACSVQPASSGAFTALLARVDDTGACKEAKSITSGYGAQVRRLAADKDNFYVAFEPSFGGQMNFNRLDRVSPWTTTYYSDVLGDVTQPVIAGASGHTYLAGTFVGQLEFGAEELASTVGAVRDGFVLRADPPWDATPNVRQFGAGSADQIVYGLVADTGSPYLTGALRDHLDFGGGAIASQGRSDVFVARPGSPAYGAGSWGVRFGEDGDEWGTAIAVGGSLVAVAGSHAGGFTIGGSPGGALAARQGRDVFVAGLDAADGAPRWSCSFGGEDDDEAQDITVGTDGAVYVVGTFRGVADLGVPTDGGKGAIFLMRITPP